jgi:hypothetical protein
MSIKQFYREAGTLYGLELESVIISLLDAGLHLTGDFANTKKIVANHYRANQQAVAMIMNARVGNFGVEI